MATISLDQETTAVPMDWVVDNAGIEPATSRANPRNPGEFDGTDMDKHNLAPVALNKAEALCRIEPIHCRSIPSSSSASIRRAREPGAARGL